MSYSQLSKYSMKKESPQIQPLQAKLKKVFIQNLFKMTSLSKLSEKDANVIKFSQFSKVCISKYGSRSSFIRRYVNYHDKYFQEVEQIFSLMKSNIFEFIFGANYESNITKELQQHDGSRTIDEDFGYQADRKVHQIISRNLYELMGIYTDEKIKEVKKEMLDLQKNNEFDEQRIKQCSQQWQKLLDDALNINTLQQVLTDITEITTQLKKAREELSKSVLSIHTGQVLKSLHAYSFNTTTEYTIANKSK